MEYAVVLLSIAVIGLFIDRIRLQNRLDKALGALEAFRSNLGRGAEVIALLKDLDELGGGLMEIRRVNPRQVMQVTSL